MVVMFKVIGVDIFEYGYVLIKVILWFVLIKFLEVKVIVLRKLSF